MFLLYLLPFCLRIMVYLLQHFFVVSFHLLYVVKEQSNLCSLDLKVIVVVFLAHVDKLAVFFAYLLLSFSESHVVFSLL
jgi:hypothetical protein